MEENINLKTFLMFPFLIGKVLTTASKPLW